MRDLQNAGLTIVVADVRVALLIQGDPVPVGKGGPTYGIHVLKPPFSVDLSCVLYNLIKHVSISNVRDIVFVEDQHYRLPVCAGHAGSLENFIVPTRTIPRGVPEARIFVLDVSVRYVWPPRRIDGQRIELTAASVLIDGHQFPKFSIPCDHAEADDVFP